MTKSIDKARHLDRCGREQTTMEPKLIDAWTPNEFDGYYPPFINLTLVSYAGKEAAQLTIRQREWANGRCGDTVVVSLDAEMLDKLAAMIPKARAALRGEGGEDDCANLRL